MPTCGGAGGPASVVTSSSATAVADYVMSRGCATPNGSITGGAGAVVANFLDSPEPFEPLQPLELLQPGRGLADLLAGLADVLSRLPYLVHPLGRARPGHLGATPVIIPGLGPAPAIGLGRG